MPKINLKIILYSIDDKPINAKFDSLELFQKFIKKYFEGKIKDV